MAPVLALLKTVFASILEVFLICLAGYILARKGVLDKKTQKQLNRLNVSLFTPCLLFSKVAFFLSPAKLRELWIIPLFFVIVTLVSMAIAYGLGVIFRLKRTQRSFAIASSMFMNSNSLPIALMQSLVVTVPGLKWDNDDTKSSMLGRALTYLVLYSTLGMVLRWSYGVHLLSQADPEPLPAVEVNDVEEETSLAATPILAASEDTIVARMDEESTRSDSSSIASSSSSSHSSSSSSSKPRKSHRSSVVFADETLIEGVRAMKSRDLDGKNDDNLLSVKPSGRRGKVFYSFPNTPARSVANLPSLHSDDSLSGSGDLSLPGPDNALLPSSNLSSPSHSRPRYKRVLRRVKRATRKFLYTFNEFMTAPLWAAFLSLVVALVQPLQHALYAHLTPIKGALDSAGNCSIPVTLVVLGAYFYRAPEEDSSSAGGVLPSTVQKSSGPHGDEGNVMESPSRTSQIMGSMRSALGLQRRDSKIALSKAEIAAKPLPGETKTVLISIVARMVLTPLVLLPLMALGSVFDIPPVFDDPVFVVSNILLISSPPALTLAQITQAASGDAFERLLSRTIFWAYCVVTPPATILYVVIGLMFAKL